MNDQHETISLNWVDYDGVPVKYTVLQADYRDTLYTYGTHPWIITNAANDTIAYFVPMTSDLSITVG